MLTLYSRGLRLSIGVGLLLVLATGGGWYLLRSKGDLTPLTGKLVFVSDRDGIDALYVRDLKTHEERQLTYLNEAVREPAVSPDGASVAFSMGGRIGLVSPQTGRFQIITLGVDWQDSSPSWRPDGKALLVASRAPGEHNADIHLLILSPNGPFPSREPLTSTPGLDEQTPVFEPSGTGVVFTREDNLFRLDLKDGRVRRLTGGFRAFRYPRFLPSGRLLYMWSEGKRFGIDVMDGSGKNRETLAQGRVCYRTISPSRDGRYLAGTFAFDLGFDPADALKLRQTEEVRLLGSDGKALGVLARSRRFANHSPEWLP